jgi:hypothetical protein
VTSRLAALRKERRHPQLRVAIERSRSREWLRRRATVGEVMRGSGDPRLCSRDRIDCRKSTGGAWPFTPRGEESLDHEDGSSSSARERWRGEEASEAESPVAKPRDRWRVPPKRNGRESDLLGSTCRWKTLWVEEVALTDEGAAETILASRERHPGNRVAFARRDRERQRSFASAVRG